MYLAGITPYPDQPWMAQQARNVTMKDGAFWRLLRYYEARGSMNTGSIIILTERQRATRGMPLTRKSASASKNVSDG